MLFSGPKAYAQGFLHHNDIMCNIQYLINNIHTFPNLRFNLSLMACSSSVGTTLITACLSSNKINGKIFTNARERKKERLRLMAIL